MLLQRKGLLSWLGVFRRHPGFERPREQRGTVPECATRRAMQRSPSADRLRLLIFLRSRAAVQLRQRGVSGARNGRNLGLAAAWAAWEKPQVRRAGPALLADNRVEPSRTCENKWCPEKGVREDPLVSSPAFVRKGAVPSRSGWFSKPWSNMRPIIFV